MRFMVLTYRNLLPLHGTGIHPFDDVPLRGEVEDDGGADGQAQQGHHGTHIAVTVGANEGLDDHRDGLVSRGQANDQVWQQVVVPHPHGIENGHGDGSWLEQRQDYPEVVLERTTDDEHRSFLDLQRHEMYDAAKPEPRNTGPKTA